jgi:flavin-dependent dehydrogenase
MRFSLIALVGVLAVVHPECGFVQGFQVVTPPRAARTRAFLLRSTAIDEDPKEQAANKNEDNKKVKVSVAPVIETKSDNDDLTSSSMSLTERIMKSIEVENQVGGAGGSSTWEAFQRMEANWERQKQFQPFEYDAVAAMGGIDPSNPHVPPPPQFVTQDAAMGRPEVWDKLRALKYETKKLDYDVVVCGGTLGVFFATALQLKGHSVCVLEAGKLQGREQEWNISMNEMLELVQLGVLTHEDIDAAVQTEFPGCRSGFKNKEVTPLTEGYFENDVGYECVTPDVLNLGVAPAVLIERVSKRFVALGGVVKEETRLQGVVVSDSIGAAVDLGEAVEPVTSRLVIDCMGNGSPISRQQRYGKKPDGICAVVGSCASGFEKENNLVGDIIYTNSKIENKGDNGQLQYFWEAFPVGIGRNGKEPGTSDVKTTYMFTYLDADEQRPTMESIMNDYWKQLPLYQNSITNPETDLEFRRVLCAFFPTYKDSPLQPAWNRVLAVGDASGIQSPLSFGGFGALTRHLDRISDAISDALDDNLLSKEDLSRINAYTPNLSAAWMFQKAMSVRMGQKVDPDFVNRLLAVNFEVMDGMGQRTIKPFLQDIIRFDGLIGSLALSFVKDPTFMPQIVAHVGVPTLAVWVGHVAMMGSYGFLDTYVSPVLMPFVEKMKDPRERFQWKRQMEAWKFGSGNDYELPEQN